MIETVAEPLVPAELDLRDFPYMPLEVVRLRDSDLAATASGDEFRSAVLLWCAAWHQVPASSLPDDDRKLAYLAGFGRSIDQWRVVRDAALRGFVRCSDGRLYHPVIAEKAIEADSKRRSQRKQTQKARDARAREAPPTLPFDGPAQSAHPPPRNNIANSALCNRDQEKGSEEKDHHRGGDARAREPLLSDACFRIAADVGAICGYATPADWPSSWSQSHHRIQAWLNHGWPEQSIIAACRDAMAQKRDGPPSSVNYFEKPIAKWITRANAPVNLPSVSQQEVNNAQPAADWKQSKDAFRRSFSKLCEHNEQQPVSADGGTAGAEVIQLIAAPGRA